MEKVGALIGRLQQQYNDKADEKSLLQTAMMLVTELQSSHSSTTSAKVSVIMPFKPVELKPEAPAEVQTEEQTNVAPDVQEEAKPQAPDAENTAGKPETDKTDTIAAPDASQESAAEEPAPPVPAQTEEPVEMAAVNTIAQDKYNEVLEQVPTLAQQTPKVFYQLNDTQTSDEQPNSINDRLKPRVVEQAAKLQAEPIKDLRKAIGINDKYLFIKELFRNDETAYERSIKTINSFNVLQEAEYWIQREMKYKLGWDDNNSTVQTFYNLVKRRFS